MKIGQTPIYVSLNDAKQELKETEFRDLFMANTAAELAPQCLKDCAVETDLDVLIPDT